MNKFVTLACAVAIAASAGAVSAAPLSVLPTGSTSIVFVNAMTMTVGTSTKIHAQPVSSSKVVSVLAPGTQITVLDKTANGLWAHIQMGTMTGYVRVKTLK